MKIKEIIKYLDKKTGNYIGNFIRTITNPNTEKFWDKRFSVRDSVDDFRYKYFVEFLPKSEVFSLLDIGCAMGEGCALIKKHLPKAEISGADFSSVGIKKAKERNKNIPFFTMDIKKENLPKKYDYITLIHILEHFDDPYPIIDKCLKCTNKALIVEVPYTKEFDSPRLYTSMHRYLFNKNSFSNYKYEVLKITEYIESAGYKYIIFKIVP